MVFSNLLAIKVPAEKTEEKEGCGGFNKQE